MEMEDVVVEIERLLKLKEVPASPEQPAQGAHPTGYQLGKLLHATKVLVDTQNVKNDVDPVDEIFLEYAKSTSIAYASLYNAVNLFGATTSWLIRESSHHLNKHQNMRMIFVALTLVFLPLSLVTVGLANSLKPKPDKRTLINVVAVLLFIETAYMAMMCGFFAYYLIDQSDEPTVLLLAILGAGVLIIIPWVIYRRPRC